MGKYRWGTLYLADPGWALAQQHRSRFVVQEFPGARSSFDVARELWQIAGRTDRAEQLETTLERSYAREQPHMDERDVLEVLRLLDGLETALSATVLDEQGRVSPEKLVELRAATETLWISEDREEAAMYGVREGLYFVQELQEILEQARAQRLLVVID